MEEPENNIQQKRGPLISGGPLRKLFSDNFLNSKPYTPEVLGTSEASK